MQRLEVRGAVRPIYGSLGVKRLSPGRWRDPEACTRQRPPPTKKKLQKHQIQLWDTRNHIWLAPGIFVHWNNSAKSRRMIPLPGRLWGCTGPLDKLGYEETKSPTSSQETVLFKMFAGPEPSLGVSRKNIRRKIQRWMVNQHFARWRGLRSTHKQARELISCASPAAKTRVLSFDRIRGRTIKFANSPPCACRGSTGQKP